MSTTPLPEHSIDELTVLPSDVYEGNGSSGSLTALGLKLRESNPCLTECLIGQAQYDLAAKYSALYPKVKTRPVEAEGLRRPSHPIGPITSAPNTVSSKRLPDDALPALFGRSSYAGAANRLAKTNIELYRNSKSRAIELGLLPPACGSGRA
jgi:hypothetical protein